MNRRDQINHKDYYQLRFVFTHPEFGDVEVFATSPKPTKTPSIRDISIQSAGVAGDLHADAEDISEPELDLMRLETLRFLSSQDHQHD